MKKFILLLSFFYLSISGYSVVINGDTEVCILEFYEYTVEGLPTVGSYNISWELTPDDQASLLPGDPSCTIFWYDGQSNYYAILKACVTIFDEDGNQIGYEEATLGITIVELLDPMGTISGPQNLYAGISYSNLEYSVDDVNTTIESEKYHWSIESGNATIVSTDNTIAYINTSGCNSFTISVYATYEDCELTTNTSEKIVTKSVNVNGFETEGDDMLCQYPLGNHTSVYSITYNQCVEYLWYTQTHYNPANPTDNGRVGDDGFKKLEIVGNNNESDVTVKATGEGDTKLYVRVTYSGGNFTREIPIHICSNVPDQPYHIWYPYQHCTSVVETYSTIMQDYVDEHAWTVEAPAKIIPLLPDNMADIWCHIYGKYDITVQAHNPCGWSIIRTGLADIVNCGKSVITEISETKSDIVKVYPNPVKDILNIQLPNVKVYYEIMIFNSVGKLVINKKPSSTNIEISTKELSEGIYLLQIVGEGHQHTEKIMVEK